MKDKIKNDNEEVEILKALQNCEQIPKIIDVFHSDYQTILITEYFAGRNLLLLFKFMWHDPSFMNIRKIFS